MRSVRNAWRIAVVAAALTVGVTYVVLAGRRENPKIMASSKLRQIAVAALLYANPPATRPAVASTRPTTTQATQPATQPMVAPLDEEKR